MLKEEIWPGIINIIEKVFQVLPGAAYYSNSRNEYRFWLSILRNEHWSAIERGHAADPERFKEMWNHDGYALCL